MRSGHFLAGELACESTGILLRPLSLEDRELFVAIYSDANLMREVEPALSPADASTTFDRTLRLCEKTNPRSAYMVAVAKRSRKPIGICAASRIDLRAGSAEVGIMLLATATERSLGTPALALLMGQLFTVLELEEIWAQHAPTNRLAHIVGLGAGMKSCAPKECWGGRAGMHFVSVQRDTWFGLPKNPIRLPIAEIVAPR
jgi:RimJ/RimL family protein N-acetyltransferase